MILETKNKTVNLVLKTRKIVSIANSLNNKNFEDAYFKAVQNNDLNALSKIIFTLAEDNDGKHCFKSSDEVYDFLDDYRVEKEKTYDDIFKELTEVINEEGFFKKKMTTEELQEKISNLMSSINIESIIKNATEKATTNIIQTEFQGYKA